MKKIWLIVAAAFAFWFFFLRKPGTQGATPLPKTLTGSSLASRFDRTAGVIGASTVTQTSGPSPIARISGPGFAHVGNALWDLLNQGVSGLSKAISGFFSPTPAERPAVVGSLGLENTGPYGDFGGEFMGEGDPNDFSGYTPADIGSADTADFGTGDYSGVDTSPDDSEAYYDPVPAEGPSYDYADFESEDF